MIRAHLLLTLCLLLLAGAAKTACADDLTSMNGGNITSSANYDLPDLSGSKNSTLSVSATGALLKKNYSYSNDSGVVSTTGDSQSPPPPTSMYGSNTGNVEANGQFTMTGSREGNQSTLSVSACGTCALVSSSSK